MRLKFPCLSGSGCGTPCRRKHLAYAKEAVCGSALGRAETCRTDAVVLLQATRLPRTRSPAARSVSFASIRTTATRQVPCGFQNVDDRDVRNPHSLTAEGTRRQSRRSEPSVRERPAPAPVTRAQAVCAAGMATRSQEMRATELNAVGELHVE